MHQTTSDRLQNCTESICTGRVFAPGNWKTVGYRGKYKQVTIYKSKNDVGRYSCQKEYHAAEKRKKQMAGPCKWIVGRPIENRCVNEKI
jgi:hypothetical protein